MLIWYLTVLLNIHTFSILAFFCKKEQFLSFFLYLLFLFLIISLVRTLTRSNNKYSCVISGVNGNISNILPFKCDVYCRFLINAFFLDAFQVGYGLVERESAYTPHTHVFLYIYTNIHVHTHRYIYIHTGIHT